MAMNMHQELPALANIPKLIPQNFSFIIDHSLMTN